MGFSWARGSTGGFWTLSGGMLRFPLVFFCAAGFLMWLPLGRVDDGYVSSSSQKLSY